MMGNTNINDRKLMRRARTLRDRYAARDQGVANALSHLCEVGRVALIGGALRELYFNPPSRFASDLDFVVEVEDVSSFNFLISRYGARANNFGGYGIKFNSGISVDFWSAVDTWASVKGHRQVSRLEDIVDTTFFNVDAILYVLGENRLVAKEGTRRALDERYLDINLLPNPNPAGAAVRAIRRLIEHDMTGSDNLLSFIAEQIDRFGWSSLVNLDYKAYRHKPLLRLICDKDSWTGNSFLRYTCENKNRFSYCRQFEFEFARAKSA